MILVFLFTSFNGNSRDSVVYWNYDNIGSDCSIYVYVSTNVNQDPI